MSLLWAEEKRGGGKQEEERLVSLPKSENECIPVPAYAWLQSDEKTVCRAAFTRVCA